VVTGASAGIGAETARRLLLAGAEVVLACRTTSKAEALLDQWRQTHGPLPNAHVMALDLCSFDAVDAFAKDFTARFPRLDVLINNAGVYHMGTSERRQTPDRYEEHLQVNFLSPVLLTNRLLGSLRNAPSPRVLFVASSIHKLGGYNWDDFNITRRPYSSFLAYADSKLYTARSFP
ncbi:uncharacterized protein MONBRDRAFT_15143, partial [Monosiga brevicollis MX1]